MQPAGGRMRCLRRNLPRTSARPTHPARSMVSQQLLPNRTLGIPSLCLPSGGKLTTPHSQEVGGGGRNASSGTLPAGNTCQIVPCSILSPGHLGLDHLGVQRGGGRPLCRTQPWRRCRTRCHDSSEPKPDHLEPPWPKVGAGDAWGFKGLPGPPRAVPRGQAQ